MPRLAGFPVASSRFSAAVNKSAVAVGMASGPQVGLAALERVAASGALDGYYPLPAARADLFRRLGDYSKAAAFYRVALAGAPTQPERDFFARRLDEVGG